jgi:hypothetical protein
METNDDDDIGMNLNDFDAGVQLEDKKSKKAITIVIISATLFLLIAAVIIFIMFLPNDKNESSAEIICKYNIQNISQNVSLLYSQYKSYSKLDIFIDNKRYKNITEYKFDKIGEHSVIFRINNDSINMDNMFKDVQSLNYVEMKSNKNAIIESLISSFENCQNLNSFSISGFNTSNIISTQKLFKNTNISKVDLSQLNMEKIEDMSFMFSNCISLTSLDLNN